MVGRRLRSTLFPYTTLFRSGPALVDHGHVGQDVPAVDGIGLVSDDVGGGVRQVGGVHPRASAPVPGRLLFEPHLLDRKSTRLNSSHANISYAVFCLKKKS